MAYVVGVDVGGTTISAALVDARGRIASRLQAPTHEGPGGPALDRVVRVVRRLAEERDVVGLGAGLAGALSLDGVMAQSPNVPRWDGVPLRRELARKLPFPVVVENDANAFVLGEWWKGAARRAKVAVGMTVGTGVGGGLVVDGRIFRGAHGYAGEFGHMANDVNGLPCTCGARGCLEAHVSGHALARIVRDAAAAQSLDVEPSAKALFAAGRRGAGWANALLDDVANRLGAGLGGLVNALNPDVIVLGGSVARDFPVIRRRALAAMRRSAFREAARRVRVKVGTLGRDAAMVGAAKLAFDELERARGDGRFARGSKTRRERGKI